MERAFIGIDGNCGSTLLGENLQEGEAEFVEIPAEDGVRTLHQREVWACNKSYQTLKNRLGLDHLSYALHPSHPNYC